MRKEKQETIFYSIIAFIDLLLLSVALVLQYLSSQKMGVMRYLVFLRNEFEKGWLSPHLVNIYELILGAGLILCLLFIIYSTRIRKSKGILQASVLAIIADVLGYFLLTSQTLSSLRAYPLLVIVFFVIIIFQYIILIYQVLKKPR